MKEGVVVIIHIFVQSAELERVAEALKSIPEVLDLYEVTGEYDLIAIVGVETIADFRQLLKSTILAVPGVRSTVTSVVLHTHKKDGKTVE